MTPSGDRRRTKLDDFVEQAYRRGSVPDAAGNAIGLAPHSVEPEAGAALRDLAVAERAEQTIEVGLALGMSALFLCQDHGACAAMHNSCTSARTSDRNPSDDTARPAPLTGAN